MDSDWSGRNVFFFAEPTLALCVRNNAILIPTNLTRALEAGYSGADRVDRVIVVLHDDILRERKLPVIESSFRGTREWESVAVKPYTILCAGCGQAVNVLTTPYATPPPRLAHQ